MFRETLGSGDRSADSAPERADALCVALGGKPNPDAGRWDFASGGLSGHRHMDREDREDRDGASGDPGGYHRHGDVASRPEV
jgi:hypothetical protein